MLYQVSSSIRCSRSFFFLPERVNFLAVPRRRPAPAAGRFPAGWPPAPAPTAAASARGRNRPAGAGGLVVAAMLVTSWAFTVLRRCKSADGTRSAGPSCRLRATSKISRPAKPSRSSPSKLIQGLERLPRIMDQAPDQPFFRVFQLPEGGQLLRPSPRSAGRPPPCEFPPGRPLR